MSLTVPMESIGCCEYRPSGVLYKLYTWWTQLCCFLCVPFLSISTTSISPVSLRLEQERDLEMGSDMGVSQVSLSGDNPSFLEDIKKRIVEARAYMADDARKKMDSKLFKLCKNQHENCAAWAVAGECDANPKCEYICWAKSSQLGYVACLHYVHASVSSPCVRHFFGPLKTSTTWFSHSACA